MLNKEMISTVNKQRLGFVATVSNKGLPQVSPKGTFVVVDERTLAFGDIRSPGTVGNLRENPAIEVNFVNPLTRKGFRASGNARIIGKDSDAFVQNIELFERWGSLATRIKNIVFVTLTEATLLKTPAYDDGATEEELVRQWKQTLFE